MSAAVYAKTATGPRTASGKAVAGRNATTHGLFARDIVLPSLGEDPAGYTHIQNELTAELHPHTLLERHYVEKIAAASWRLRRLHRWQAQLFEDQSLTEDERLERLDKVLRHENYLHRQIDSAVRMLSKDGPRLHQTRVCESAPIPPAPDTAPGLDYTLLDAPPTPEDLQKCQNELFPPDSGTPEPDNHNSDKTPQSAKDAFFADWKRKGIQKHENERQLATLAHTVSDRDLQGHPIYINDYLWWNMEHQIALGNPDYAAQYAEDARQRFLNDQAEARAFLAAQEDAIS